MKKIKLINSLIPLFLFSCTSYKVVKHDNFKIHKIDIEKYQKEFDEILNIEKEQNTCLLKPVNNYTEILNQKTCELKLKEVNDLKNNLLSKMLNEAEISNQSHENNENILNN